MGEDYPDGRFYGVRYHECADEDLWRIAGRIMSDLKLDQSEGLLPSTTHLDVSVIEDTIMVQAFVQNRREYEFHTAEAIRARVTVVADRYGWRGVHNRADVRFKFGCLVRFVPIGITTQSQGRIIG